MTSRLSPAEGRSISFLSFPCPKRANVPVIVQARIVSFRIPRSREQCRFADPQSLFLPLSYQSERSLSKGTNPCARGCPRIAMRTIMNGNSAARRVIADLQHARFREYTLSIGTSNWRRFLNEHRSGGGCRGPRRACRIGRAEAISKCSRSTRHGPRHGPAPVPSGHF